MADNVSSDAEGPSDILACGEDSFSIEMTEHNGTQIKNKKKKNNIMSSFRNGFPHFRPKNLMNIKKESTNTGNDLGSSFDNSAQSPTSSKYVSEKVL